MEQIILIIIKIASALNLIHANTFGDRLFEGSMVLMPSRDRLPEWTGIRSIEDLEDYF
jgi:hypothetical protein